jgi:lipopolysaccharide transport system permease protein
VALLAAWILALSLVLAAIQVRVRDIGIALPVLMQVLMFASPVIYPLSVVPGAWRDFYLLNPMAGIISSFRDVLLRQVAPDPYPLGMACVVTAIGLPAAYLFFKHAEATMADLV